MVTVTQAWLGSLGSGGGSTVDNADINEITKVRNHGWYENLSELLDQTYATVKMGDGNGNGRWRPFTLVLTGYQTVTDLEKPEHKEDDHE